jgi:hypothetical protein
MPTQITSDGATLRITSENGVLLLTKSQIRTIETVRDDTVCIVVWESSLKNVYVKFSEVTQPSGCSNVAALRDAIKSMLDFGNKYEEISLAELVAIKQSLVDIKGVLSVSQSGPMSEASRIDESCPHIIYYGYALPGADPAKPVWSIKRVSTISPQHKITITDWASGHTRMEHIWDKRYNLTYLPSDK